jgi:translation initiation factor 5B
MCAVKASNKAGTMLEKSKEHAVMLCFDVKVDKEAMAYANEIGGRRGR